MYSELVYFDGAYFAHVVRWQEYLRVENIRARWSEILSRDRSKRVAARLGTSIG